VLKLGEVPSCGVDVDNSIEVTVTCLLSRISQQRSADLIKHDHPTLHNMPPNPRITCHCTKCHGKPRTFKTVRGHTDVNIRQRNHYSASDGATPQLLNHITDCITKNLQALQQFGASSESGDVRIAEIESGMYLINY
jgi:hypothetical protein